MWLAASCAAPRPLGAVPADAPTGTLPPGPPPPHRGLPIPSLAVPWSPPEVVAGDMNALSETLASASMVRIDAGPRLASVLWRPRVSALVAGFGPSVESLRVQSTRDLVTEGRLPLVRIESAGDLPRYAASGFDLAEDWRSENLPMASEDVAFALLIDDAPIPLEQWRALPAASVGSCEAPLNVLAVGQEQSLAELEGFLNHADAVLWQVYRAQLQALLPPLRAEFPLRPSGADRPLRPSGADGPLRPSGADGPLRPSGADRPLRPSGAEGPLPGSGTEEPLPGSGAEQPSTAMVGTDVGVAVDDGGELSCAQAYAEYLSVFEACIDQAVPCSSAPRLFLQGAAWVGSLEPELAADAGCAERVGRDVPAELQRMAKEAVEVAARHLSPSWTALAHRLGTVSEVYEALEDICTPRRRRFTSATLLEAQDRLASIGRALASSQVDPVQPEWVFEDEGAEAVYVAGVGLVHRIARFEPGPGSPAERVIAEARALRHFVLHNAACTAEDGPPLSVIAIDLARGVPTFLGFFYEEELLCAEVSPREPVGEPVG